MYKGNDNTPLAPYSPSIDLTIYRVCSEFGCPTPQEIESLVDAATQMLSPSQAHSI
jgi:hypothetical protein